MLKKAALLLYIEEMEEEKKEEEVAEVPVSPKGLGMPSISIRTKTKFADIPRDKLVLPTFDPRAYRSSKEVKKLTASIRRTRTYEPLLVRPSEEDKYEILDGVTTAIALEQIGIDPIHCEIVEKSTIDPLFIGFRRNVTRSNFNPMDIGKIVEYYVEKQGQDVSDVARMIGVSREWASKCYSLYKKAPDELKKLIAERRVSFKRAWRDIVAGRIPPRKFFTCARCGKRLPWKVKKLLSLCVDCIGDLAILVRPKVKEEEKAPPEKPELVKPIIIKEEKELPEGYKACPICGGSIPETATTCIYCGTAIVKKE